MKKLFVFLVIIFCMFLIGCEKGENANNNEKNIFDSIDKTYELYEGESLDFKDIFNGKIDNFVLSTTSSNISIENNVLTALSRGECDALVTVGDDSQKITINVKEKIEILYEDISMYITETKEISLSLKGCKLDDLALTSSNNNIELKKENGKYYVTGKEVGDAKITVKCGEITKEINVEVKEAYIDVKNEDLTVDVLSTLELILDYPKTIINESDITIEVVKPEVLTIENNIVYPLKEGRTKVKITAGDIKKTIEIKVTVDPIKIFELLNQEEVIMKKAIKLYGNTIEEQPLMGSVSRYMFDDLNLIEDIIQLYDNPYKGQVATREIMDYLDKKKNTSVDGAPRSGVLMTSISYITYHDTANVSAGADARANANWMVNPYSVTSTARSWHYTVDAKQVIHSVPDNEVTFQGDTYEAYTTSIGIETCVNKGTNLDKVWHRMGKLCAMLMLKYDIDVNHIKQHYDWMGKECPHTLRANGLYPYAISLVEGELLVRKYLRDYTITFESLSPEYLDNTGQIIKAPDSEITVSYKVHITNNNGYDKEVTLSSKVKPLQ